jgi:hypothetical protein
LLIPSYWLISAGLADSSLTCTAETLVLMEEICASRRMTNMSGVEIWTVPRDLPDAEDAISSGVAVVIGIVTSKVRPALSACKKDSNGKVPMGGGIMRTVLLGAPDRFFLGGGDSRVMAMVPPDELMDVI